MSTWSPSKRWWKRMNKIENNPTDDDHVVNGNKCYHLENNNNTHFNPLNFLMFDEICII